MNDQDHAAIAMASCHHVPGAKSKRERPHSGANPHQTAMLCRNGCAIEYTEPYLVLVPFSGDPSPYSALCMPCAKNEHEEVFGSPGEYEQAMPAAPVGRHGPIFHEPHLTLLAERNDLSAALGVAIEQLMAIGGQIAPHLAPHIGPPYGPVPKNHTEWKTALIVSGRDRRGI